MLPVADPLVPLLPDGGLRRGSVVSLVGGPADDARPGGTSLLLALLAGASGSGGWVAVVGVPGIGALAAAGAGVDLGRLALVPRPGPDPSGTVAALLDGVEVVAMAAPERLTGHQRSRLAARARARGSVLVPIGVWPGADVVLRCTGSRWTGLTAPVPGGAAGGGRLRHREVLVSSVSRRGSAPVAVRLLLPGADGRVATTVPPAAVPAPAAASATAAPWAASVVPMERSA